MVDNQPHKPNKPRLAEIPGWELRSPGRTDAPAENRFTPKPRSDAFEPQHINIEAAPAAAPAIPVGPAQAFELSAHRFLPSFNQAQKTKLLLMGGSAVIAASLMAVFVRTVTPPEEKLQASGNVAEQAIIMGTGPARNAETPSIPSRLARSFSRMEPGLQNIMLASAEREGLHPDLMMRLFGKESGFNSRATSDTGAAGLCQFTEQTFLGTLVKHGERLGFGQYADQIKQSKNGYYTSESILALRYKPAVAVPVCAAYIRDELQYLQAYVNRPLTFTDSSLAHFTGGGVAKDLIRAYHDPKARKDPAYIYAERVNYRGNTNRSIFFENGNFKKPYTVEELYHSKRRVMGDTPALASTNTWHASIGKIFSPK